MGLVGGGTGAGSDAGCGVGLTGGLVGSGCGGVGTALLIILYTPAPFAPGPHAAPVEPSDRMNP